MARAHVRGAARVPRVHGPRDRREPRGGDAAARARPAAQPLLRDRRRRRCHRPHRARRALGVPGAGRRRSSARRGSARRSWGSSTRSARTSVAFEHVLRVYVGLTGALILLTAAVRRTPASGGSRTRSASTASCRAAFGRLSRRSMHSPATVVAAGVISIALLARDGVHDEPGRLPREPVQFRRARRVHRRAARGDQAPFLAAGRREPVPRAALGPGAGRRRPDPDGDRSARDGGDLRRGDGDAHRRALRRPDLACGGRRRLPLRSPPQRDAVCSSTSRRPTSASCREAAFSKILVPMKLGEIGEEMMATAVKLAQERGARSSRSTSSACRSTSRSTPSCRRGGAGGGVARRGGRARRRPRSRGRGAFHPRPLDRRGNRPGGGGDRAPT